MAANNETGVLQPVAEAAEIAHDFGALMHCDAVQMAGKMALDFAALGVDYLTLSAHKLGGPQGVGALVLDAAAPLEPILFGGAQERGLRAGTENVAAIAGFGAAAEAAADGMAVYQEVARLRDRLEAGVRALAPAAEIFGADVPRLPNTSCIRMPGVAAETQVMALDLAGVCVSSGSACTSGKVKSSHVLLAMGKAAEAAGETLRVSLGWESRDDDVDRFLDAWGALLKRVSGAQASAA
jgi:cysteine desulfurase